MRGHYHLRLATRPCISQRLQWPAPRLVNGPRDKARLGSIPDVSREYNSLVPRPSSLMSCHVTCDTRPSASLRVPNEAGRSGDEANVGVRAYMYVYGHVWNYGFKTNLRTEYVQHFNVSSAYVCLCLWICAALNPEL